MITIYSTPTCTYCDKAKDFLKENNIEFTEVDVQNDLVAREEMIEKSGVRAVPVIDVDGQILTGFDKGQLVEAIERANKEV